MSPSPASPSPTPTPAPAPAPAPAARLVCLDAFRGFIMVCLAFGGFGLAATATLHLKLTPDSAFWKAVYTQWEHGAWVGCSFWDLIMPAFTFMVGMAMAYSYIRRQREGHTTAQMFRHACVRALLLIALAVFLSTSNGKPTEWIFTNVLAQIGLGYPLLFLCWNRGYRVQALAATAALGLTWLAFVLHGGSTAPGAGVTAAWSAQHEAHLAAAWHKNANVFHAFDVWFLNLFPRAQPFVFNVGGYQTLNFIPNLATMIFGLMAGEWLRGAGDPARKLHGLLLAGVAGLIAGYGLDALGVIPAVKRIWTPSFGLLSTGWCLLMLAAFYWMTELRGWTRWTQFFVIAGANSIALYCLSQLLKPWTAALWRSHLGQNIFLSAGPLWEPTLRGVAVGLTFWLVCWWLWRRKIFLRL
jgi:heparan-alpha-glucosaminide N-acetyltransferase